MDYGKTTKGAVGFAALSLLGQVGIVIGSFLLVFILAFLIRKFWRRNKNSNQK